MSKKKICFVFVFFVFIFCFKIASAEVMINEVQIGGSSATDEFIELYNSGSSDVDLTNWSVKKRTSSGSEYSLVAANRLEGKTIPAGGYFLLVNEGGYTGSTQADATWASSNTLANNNQAVLYSLSDVMDIANWGTAEIGKSFQKINSIWVNAVPTPKTQNQENTNSGSSGEEENNTEDNNGNSSSTSISGGSSSSNSSSSSSAPKPKIIPTFKANILAPTLAFAGQPIEFNLNVKYGDDIYACGKYFWNFGDGDSKQTEGGFEKFTHTFYYPGEYNVSLEYFEKKDSALPVITDYMIIKVVPMTVSISNVGDYKDFFIEISNNANSKINISNWILSSNSRSFVLPKNTVVAGSGSTIISGKISGFTITDKSSLKLSMPDGEVVFDYNSKSVPIKRVESENYRNYSNEEDGEFNEEYNDSDSYENQASSKNKKDLAGASILSEQGNVLSKYGFILGLFVLLCISAGVVYLIRRKKTDIVTNNVDFDVIDE